MKKSRDINIIKNYKKEINLNTRIKESNSIYIPEINYDNLDSIIKKVESEFPIKVIDIVFNPDLEIVGSNIPVNLEPLVKKFIYKELQK